MNFSIQQNIIKSWRVLQDNTKEVAVLVAILSLAGFLSVQYGLQEEYIAYVPPEIKAAYEAGTISEQDVFYEDIGFKDEEGFTALEVPAHGNELWDAMYDSILNVIPFIFIFVALYFARDRKMTGGTYSIKEVLYTIVTNLVYLITIIIGLIFLIIPGIYFSVIFYFSPYYALDYGMTPFTAMKKSKEAVQGKFWKIFGIMVLPVVGILVAVILLFVYMVLVAFIPSIGITKILLPLGMAIFFLVISVLVLLGMQMAAVAHVDLDVTAGSREE